MNNPNEIILLIGSGFAYNAWIDEFTKWRAWNSEISIQNGEVLDDLDQALLHFKRADKFCSQYGWSIQDSEKLFNHLHDELLTLDKESYINIMIYPSGFPKDISSLKKRYKINMIIWNLMNPWDLISQKYYILSNSFTDNSKYRSINLESELINWMTQWINEISKGFEIQNTCKQQNIEFYSLRMEEIFGSINQFRQQIATKLDLKWPNMNPIDISNFQSLLNIGRQNLPATYKDIITSELGEIALKLGYKPN